MKKYTGAQAENNEGFEKIVADGYVCKIKQAKEIKYDWGNVLSIAFDIDEGDFKGYYQKNYENQQTEDKKWKGTFRINIPTESNQYYESQKKRFNNLLFALEDSNKGFAWNWDAAEKDDYKFLAGKKIGFIFRNEEWEFNGKSGWTARAFTAKSVESIKNGKFKVPDEKPLANKPKASSEPVKFVDIEVDDEDLPF